MAKKKKKLEEEKIELSMAPMIDVTFLLLIFFMTAMEFKTEEGYIKSYLPKDRGQSTSTPIIDLKQVRIKLLWYDRSGRRPTKAKIGKVVLKVKDKVYRDIHYGEIGEKAPDYEELEADLRAFKASYKGKSEKGLPVIIDARPQVPFKHVVRVLNILVREEIKDITFAAAEKPY
jgi:biopolymer transport protein ExbD